MGRKALTLTGIKNNGSSNGLNTLFCIPKSIFGIQFLLGCPYTVIGILHHHGFSGMFESNGDHICLTMFAHIDHQFLYGLEKDFLRQWGHFPPINILDTGNKKVRLIWGPKAKHFQKLVLKTASRAHFIDLPGKIPADRKSVV